MITEKLDKIQYEKNEQSDILKKTKFDLDTEREQLKEIVASHKKLETEKNELVESSKNKINQLEENLK